MWPSLVLVRVVAVALASVALFGAGWTVNGNRWEAKYAAQQVAWADATNQAEVLAREKLEAAIKQTQEINNARLAELKALADAVGARPPTIIRVCKPALPAVGPGQGADARRQPGPPAGAVQPGHDVDPSTDFDTGPLYALAARCDAVSADLRALWEGWPK